MRVMLGSSGHGCELLTTMQFWREVTDYELYREKTTDRRLHISRAWDIFHKYISSDAVRSIGKIHCRLLPDTGHVARRQQ